MKLDKRDMNEIKKQIDEGMRSMEGDAATMTITVRQAKILLKGYEDNLLREIFGPFDSDPGGIFDSDRDGGIYE
jgi:hypothetical protein